MEIIGRGFLAHHAARYFGDRFPEVTFIAAGVSGVHVTDVTEFEREATLVYDVIRRCKAEGRTVIFLSTASSGMYGAEGSRGTEGGPVFPVSPYGRHKLCLEHVCAVSEANWLVLRLSHIVGSGQRSHQLLPSLTRQLLSGTVTVYAGVSRDLLEIGDMLRIVDSLLSSGVRNEVVNLASGRSEPIEHIVDELESRLGVEAERKTIRTTAKLATINVDKLRGLVPGFDSYRFDSSYLASLLDRNITELAENAKNQLAPTP